MTEQRPRRWDDELEWRAVAAPETTEGESRPQAEAISVASVWHMESPGIADAALGGQSGAFIYRRDGHPNERVLASKLAELHGASRALLTAQGMSSVGAVALTVLKPGSQVWIANELYGKSIKLFQADMRRWGVETTIFDPTCKNAIEELGKSSVDLVMIETMSNPRLRVPSISELADATHRAGGCLAVDNTFATHLICQPLKSGADVVIESLGKLVNGHSDSMLGLVATREADLGNRINDVISTFGMASSPLDCFLTHRGLMSLALRISRACENALALSNALSKITKVEAVDYPGLPAHTQHALAAEQFRGGFGWMLSLTMNLDRSGVTKFFDFLRPEIPFVPSLGDINTTVSHPASTSHRGLTETQRLQLGIHEGTIRVSCGAEPTDWLVGRFIKAVDQVT